jgi:hypothetical protein
MSMKIGKIQAERSFAKDIMLGLLLFLAKNNN